MPGKPTYEELEQRVRKLEEESRKGEHSSEALLESRRILQSILNSVPDLLIVVDREYNIKFTNAKGHDLIVQEDREKQKTCYGRFKLLDKPCDDCSALPVFETGCIVEREMINPADGRAREVRAFPIFDSAGKVTLVCEHVRDISDRKLAEEELRRSEILNRSLVEHLPQRIFIKDLNSTYIWSNANYCRDLGISSGEIIGKDDFSFHPIDVAEGYRADDQAVMAAGAIKDIVEKYRLAGEDRWVHTIKLPYYDENGQIIGVIGIFEDITEQILTEEASKAAEREKAVILSSLMEHVIYEDRDMKIIWANRAACESVGIQKDEIVGRYCYEIWAGREDPCPDCPVRLAMETGKPQEVEKTTQDGRTWQVRGYPVRDEHNEIVGGIEVTLEITNRVEAEENLKSLQAQLLQAQKMESVGRLAGGVAHDFNNMLQSIIGNAEIARMDIDEDHPHYQHLQEILDAANRSASIVRQLLAFARKQTASPKVLNLNNTVSNMLKMLQRLIGEDIALVWAPDSKLWKINMDPSQIDQVLINLVVNAKDAIAGIGKLNIETHNVKFDDDFCTIHPEAAPGEYVQLIVSDDGAGMNEETLKYLFEPFFTTKEAGKGTGLGLSTVYGIVKQNKGYIYVYSEPGAWTTFKIYLPRYLDRVLEDGAENDLEPMERGTETVLLVEDDESILNIGRGLLGNLGYNVLSARIPTEALRLAREHLGEIHLLITDVVMPEMNGKELAERILAVRPSMKCLYMSGYTSNVITHHGILDEGVFFISKPFSVNDFAAKVREVLDIQ